MRDWAEYEFVLPDGSCRYDLIDLTVPARPQIWALRKMHGAVIVWPVEQGQRSADYRAKRIRQLKRSHAAAMPGGPGGARVARGA